MFNHIIYQLYLMLIFIIYIHTYIYIYMFIPQALEAAGAAPASRGRAFAGRGCSRGPVLGFRV